MVDPDLVSAQLAGLSERVARVRTHQPQSVDELRSNQDQLDLVSFNLMMSVQICADIASHVIADEGWPGAQTLAEGFERLAQREVIAADLATVMEQAVGICDVVAHGYVRADGSRIFIAATDGLIDLDDFARQIARWIASTDH